MKASWDTFWHSQQGGGRFTKVSWSKRRITKILDKYVQEGMTVLDAGCGSGFFSSYFISKRCNVYSLDYSKEALEIARETTKGKSVAYLSKDLLDGSLRSQYNKTFNVIFTDGLFEHFLAEEQEEIMKTLIAMKANQGVIITFVPNQYSFWTLIRPIFMPGIKEKPFTLKRLMRFVEKSGQKIIESGGINVLPIEYSIESLGGRFGMLVYVVSS